MDIRHMADATLDVMEKELRAKVDELARPSNSRGCTVEWTPLFANPAVVFHKDCVGAIRTAGEKAAGKDQLRDIYSGAGHDSCLTALHNPTGMIFVPCKDGLSHNPEEYCKPEDCALGTQILLDAVLLYDAQRSS
jgi:acetylornithine deacetylase/succinyl-diaminopimelate desuccinylase-like protein